MPHLLASDPSLTQLVTLISAGSAFLVGGIVLLLGSFVKGA